MIHIYYIYLLLFLYRILNLHQVPGFVSLVFMTLSYPTGQTWTNLCALAYHWSSLD